MKRLITGGAIVLFFTALASCRTGESCDSYGHQNYEKYKTMKVKRAKDNSFSYKKKRYNLEFQSKGG